MRFPLIVLSHQFISLQNIFFPYAILTNRIVFKMLHWGVSRQWLHLVSHNCTDILQNDINFPCWRRQQIPPKTQHTYTRLQRVISQKTGTFSENTEFCLWLIPLTRIFEHPYLKLRYRVTFDCFFFRKFQNEIWKYVFQNFVVLKSRLIKKLGRILRFSNACCPLVTAFWDRKSYHLVSTAVSAEYSASSFKVHFYPHYKSNTLLRELCHLSTIQQFSYSQVWELLI